MMLFSIETHVYYHISNKRTSKRRTKCFKSNTLRALCLPHLCIGFLIKGKGINDCALILGVSINLDQLDNLKLNIVG